MAEGETGRIQIAISAADAGNESNRGRSSRHLQGKIVLGLWAERGIPVRPDGPSVGVRVRLKGNDAQVQVVSSDESGRKWLAFGKFSVPLNGEDGKFDTARLADALAEGLLNRLVRVQLVKGPRDKDKPTYRLRIDNASPLILNGLAALGMESQKDQAPRVLSRGQHPAASQHDGAGERGSGQEAGPEARHPRRRASTSADCEPCVSGAVEVSRVSDAGGRGFQAGSPRAGQPPGGRVAPP